MDGKTFREYMCYELRNFSDCYMCRVDFRKEVEMLKKLRIQLVAEDEALL